jgi:hypothetical protein
MFIHQTSWAGSQTDRERYGLKGSATKVVSTTAKLSDKFGQWVEGARLPSEMVTFDSHGELMGAVLYNQEGVIKANGVPTADAEGNLAKEVFYVPPSWPLGKFLDGTVKSVEVYNYDADGKRTESASYDADGMLTVKTVYTYDAKGNVVEEAVYSRDGILKSKTMHMSDANGNRTEEAVFSAQGKIESRKMNTYDASGNVTEEIVDAANGKLQAKTAYAYEYDSSGNWIKKTTSVWVSKFGQSYYEPSEVVYRTVTYVNQKGE